MTKAFDPYYKWLAIPPGKRPPHHYELLGIPLFETDSDVIQNAADRRMAHIKSFSGGPHGKISQFLLNQLSEARVCLLNEEKRVAYDRQLRLARAAEIPVMPADHESDSHRHQRTPWLAIIFGFLVIAVLAVVVVFLTSRVLSGTLLSSMKPFINQKPDGITPSDPPMEPGNSTTTLDNSMHQPAGGHGEAEQTTNARPNANDSEDRSNPMVPRTELTVADSTELQSSKPLSDSFYAKLDDAFLTLGTHSYADYQHHRRTAIRMAQLEGYDESTVKPHLDLLENIGDSYEKVWELANRTIPRLKRHDVLVSRKRERVRVVTATPDKLVINMVGDQRKTYESQQVGGITVFPAMSPKFIIYLAERAGDKSLEARTAIRFFDGLDPDQFPNEAKERWLHVRQVWAEAVEFESARLPS